MSVTERWHKFRELPPNIEQTLEQLPSLLSQEDVLLVYLFGSHSRSQAGNDIDLAFLTRHTPVFRLRDLLTNHLNTERLDLVDLRHASPVMRFEVISTGHLVYAAGEMQQARFEMATIRLYKDTAHLRRQQRRLLKRRMTQWSLNAQALKND